VPAEIASMILTTILATSVAGNETPEPDLIEFLGKFETSDGRWVDPTSLDSGPTETMTAPEKPQ